MPRKSSAANVISIAPNVSGTPTRISAPASLTKEEQQLFTELVSSCPPMQFVPSDAPLLVTYIQCTIAVRRAAKDTKAFQVFRDAAKLQTMLATRLRLTPHARVHHETLARQQSTNARSWEIKR